ncbi:Mitochondrial distribution and morphology protein 10 [Entomortierella chlamydospora]|uniref:Mitochondrial distribution and morphology protein 10 n=1 Tax=Entomortierella chlamydospora TaxID=101097 RepID=A0A9P6MVR6_9FUNG|nr:Mitochondrial distribution and morphology protein 10 [Entomortierella chlamydospora]
MYDFMEYCLRRYYRASGWNEDNQYSQLCATSRALLDFQAPQGLSLRLSKLPSSVFKTTTTMNALPILEGSLGYLFTSRALMIDDSASVRFRHLVDRFRIICLDHSIREADHWTEFDQDGKKRKDYLLCGRMNLANARLEALYSRRVSKHRQYVISGISDPASRSASHDFDDSYEDMLNEGRRRHGGKHTEQVLLNNFDSGSIELEQASAEPASASSSSSSSFSNSGSEEARKSIKSNDRRGYLGEETPEEESLMQSERIRGYWSTGAELYYSATEKLGGLSMGLRYRTLPPLAPIPSTSNDDDSTTSEATSKAPRYPTSTAPEQHQNYIPITVTQTLNPIMGHVSSSYAAQVHPDLGLCSRFDFNLYSYDSELTAGVEWWIRERKGTSSSVVDQEQSSIPFPKTVGVPDLPAPKPAPANTEELQPIVGVIKARLGVQSGLAIMWEGRFNKLLFSLGFVGHVFSPHAKAPIVKSVGLEIQYFS